MPNIAQNLQHAQAAIDAIAHTQKVELIAVSKTFPSALIRQAYTHGQRKFAESYPQELEKKVAELTDLAIEWHFIGNIQSNKTKLLAQQASWVHTITKLQHAKRLNDQRPAELAPLQVLIEVNISQESNKQGVNNWQELIQLAQVIMQLPRLKLRGLMGMASATNDQQLIQAQFQQLGRYLEQLNTQGLGNFDQLSMGMSADYPLAIKAGATLVRIGSNIFGARTYDN